MKLLRFCIFLVLLPPVCMLIVLAGMWLIFVTGELIHAVFGFGPVVNWIALITAILVGCTFMAVAIEFVSQFPRERRAS